MTIKDFAKLCDCSTQTLRYYDSIHLLKPAKVDETNGYRYYEKEQALDFVQIKNLQEASFTIDEIKKLLGKDQETIYGAFCTKLEEQEKKLQKIKEIQMSYRNDYMKMQERINHLKDMMLADSTLFDSTKEFGIAPEKYEQIIGHSTEQFDEAMDFIKTQKISDGRFVFLDGNEPEIVSSPLDDMNLSVCREMHGWKYTKEVLDALPVLEGDYVLYFEVEKEKACNRAFCYVVINLLMEKASGKQLSYNCRCKESKDQANHFWLLKNKGY